MKRKSKKLRYGCWKCDEYFISWQKRNKHLEEDHKPLQKTIKKFVMENDSHSLLNGRKYNLKLGDKLIFTKRGVVTKITLTENSDTAEVECSLTENNWNRDEN